MKWDVDGVRVTRIVEQVIPFPIDFFAEATPGDLTAEPWLAPDFIDDRLRYLMSLHTFVIEAGGRRIVVDTCSGNAKDRPLFPPSDHQDRPFLADLTAAGFAPDTIDTVVCTHLHFDHVGWNTRRIDGRWLPTFPRARYVFAAADINCWGHSDDPLHAPAFADSIQPVIDAGLVDAVVAETELAHEIYLRPTPGHTPGHQSIWIGDRCVITGDVLHHPIQCRHPQWTASGDLDPQTAQTTRRELLAAAAATGALVLGTHFAGSSSGRVLATADGYRFAPDAAA